MINIKNLKSEKYNIKLPVWAIPAIYNNDYSGLTEQESEQLNNYLDNLPKDYDGKVGTFMMDGAEDIGYFHPFNDINNLGGDVVDMEYISIQSEGV